MSDIQNPINTSIMKIFFKKLMEFLLPHNILMYWRNFYVVSFQKKLYKEWKENGCPVPPPHLVKQKLIKDYKRMSNYTILVETGTYRGDMVEAMKNNFDNIYSIELGQDLYEKAKKRFKKYDHIHIIQGDSGKVLPQVIDKIDKPTIFWLDGHYSAGETARGDKDCPIFEELDAIFNGKKLNHILLIDDARLFNGNGDYPTFNELEEHIKKYKKNYKMDVKDDVIRFVI